MVVATYSVPDEKWTEYKDLETLGGSVAISPDGSKLACLMRKAVDAPAHLHILDLKTGKVTFGPELWEYDGTKMSWSPDARRIAFVMDVNRTPDKGIPTLRPAIHVLDVETGKVVRVTDGRAPAWSPSGEWIAYLDSSPDEDPRPGSSAPIAHLVKLVHPDGTEARVLLNLRRDEMLKVAPVWSPDSKTILLNRFRDELKATMDIYTLDLGTLRLTRKFKDSPPVYAWIEAQIDSKDKE